MYTQTQYLLLSVRFAHNFVEFSDAQIEEQAIVTGLSFEETSTPREYLESHVSSSYQE